MRQPEDVFTLDLIDPVVKRGRGRPRKADALTPAQRAQRYRDKLAEGGYTGRHAAWSRERQQKRESLDLANKLLEKQGYFSPDTPFPGNGP